MDSRTRRAAPWLAAAIAVLLVGSALALGDGGADRRPSHTARLDSGAGEAGATSPTAAGAGAGAAGGGGGTAGATAGANGGAPAGEAAAGSGAAGGKRARQLVAVGERPRAGRYRYAVETARGRSEQSVAVRVDGRRVTFSAAGNSIEDWSWDDDGAAMDAVRFPGSDGRERKCEFEPPVAQFVFPIAVGATWKGEGTCRTSSDSGDSYRMDRWLEARVARPGEATIGGEAVPVWVLEVTERVSVRVRFTPPPDHNAPTVPQEYSVESEFTGTVEFSPGAGLVVHRAGKTKTTSSQDPQERESTEDRRLLNLDPE